MKTRKYEDIFGMTALMIVDTVRCAYDWLPQLPHTGHYGDEVLIGARRKLGKLGPDLRSDEATSEAVKRCF